MDKPYTLYIKIERVKNNRTSLLLDLTSRKEELFKL